MRHSRPRPSLIRLRALGTKSSAKTRPPSLEVRWLEGALSNGPRIKPPDGRNPMDISERRFCKSIVLLSRSVSRQKVGFALLLSQHRVIGGHESHLRAAMLRAQLSSLTPPIIFAKSCPARFGSAAIQRSGIGKAARDDFDRRLSRIDHILSDPEHGAVRNNAWQSTKRSEATPAESAGRQIWRHRNPRIELSGAERTIGVFDRPIEGVNFREGNTGGLKDCDKKVRMKRAVDQADTTPRKVAWRLDWRPVGNQNRGSGRAQAATPRCR